jgi:hypothetical protein
LLRKISGPKKNDIPEELGKLHNRNFTTEIKNCYYAHNTVRVIKYIM